jgi:hypothetical protein
MPITWPKTPHSPCDARWPAFRVFAMLSRALLSGVTAVVLIAALADSRLIAVRAETPTPTPAQIPSPVPLPTITPGPGPTLRTNICESALSVTPGGTAIVFGSMELVLPVGYDYVWLPIGTASSTDAGICVPALNSSLFISGDDGHETFRSVNNPSANSLFAEILSSVHLYSCRVGIPRVSGPTETAMGAVTFNLPTGTFALSLNIADPGGFGWTTVCYVEGNSEIGIGNDCKEVSRKVLKPEASAVLDQVRSNARCAAPQSIPTPIPPDSLGSLRAIGPPETGGAGLKGAPTGPAWQMAVRPKIW